MGEEVTLVYQWNIIHKDRKCICRWQHHDQGGAVPGMFREPICHQSINNSEELSMNIYHAAAQSKKSPLS